MRVGGCFESNQTAVRFPLLRPKNTPSGEVDLELREERREKERVELVRPIPTLGGGDGYTKKEVVDMEKLKQTTLQEFLAIVRLKVARGKKKFPVVFPATSLPPRELKPFRTTIVEDQITGWKIHTFLKPDPEKGCWVAHVRVVQPPLNPLSTKEEELRRIAERMPSH